MTLLYNYNISISKKSKIQYVSDTVCLSISQNDKKLFSKIMTL